MCGYLFPQPVQLDIHVVMCELRGKFRNKFPIQGHGLCPDSSRDSNTGLSLNIFVLE